MPYNEAIGMWSLGLVATELATGYPLYPGDTDYDVLSFIIETQGQPSDSVLDRGMGNEYYFKRQGNSWKFKTPEEFAVETGYYPMDTRHISLGHLDELVQLLESSPADICTDITDTEGETPEVEQQRSWFRPQDQRTDFARKQEQTRVRRNNSQRRETEFSHRVEDFLKEGGFGFVTKCHNTETNKVEAIKCLQTTWYRAPEVMLHMPYNETIGMWSLGLVATELATGYPLYPGDTDYDVLSFIIETQGQPSDSVLDRGMGNEYYFKRQGNSWKFKTPEEFAVETGYYPMDTRHISLGHLDELVQLLESSPADICTDITDTEGETPEVEQQRSWFRPQDQRTDFARVILYTGKRKRDDSQELLQYLERADEVLAAQRGHERRLTPEDGRRHQRFAWADGALMSFLDYLAQIPIQCNNKILSILDIFTLQGQTIRSGNLYCKIFLIIKDTYTGFMLTVTLVYQQHSLAALVCKYSSFEKIKYSGYTSHEELNLKASGGSCNVEIQFSPRHHISSFTAELQAEFAGLLHHLLTIQGCCQGVEVQLDQDHLAFGAVVQRCQARKRIVMMNTGDIGASPDATVSLKGLEYIDVPALAKREYKMSLFTYREGQYNTKVTFRNMVSGEYLFYLVTFKATSPGVLSTIELETTVRRTASVTVQVENPLTTATCLSTECKCADISAPPQHTVDVLDM
ncbi:hypothetical protein L3Q82_007371 [Scortum barcoo]|uniref:Uncharacterized protein n=1 Tax=Scortum barcoo TaxID=214431 RepID=A0ACB8WTC5_9TELE|nr:hypothetical protein L3Q82_007371 [Scortum barcoo]